MRPFQQRFVESAPEFHADQLILSRIDARSEVAYGFALLPKPIVLDTAGQRGTLNDMEESSNLQSSGGESQGLRSTCLYNSRRKLGISSIEIVEHEAWHELSLMSQPLNAFKITS